MPDPDLYSLVKMPVVGQIGEATEWQEFPACPSCGRSERKEIARLEYQLDYYQGEPILTAQSYYAISEPLKQALESNGLVGFELQPADATWNDEIPASQRGGAAPPSIHYLRILDTLAAGPGWTTPGDPCPQCGTRAWQFTGEGIAAMTGEKIDTGPRRNLIRSGYAGQDIFRMDDIASPVLTKRFLNLLEAQGATGMKVQPVDLID